MKAFEVIGPQKKTCILHDFPKGYDQTLTEKVKQLCTIGTVLGNVVIITKNVSEDNTAISQIINPIRASMIPVGCDEQGFNIQYLGDKYRFQWYKDSAELF